MCHHQMDENLTAKQVVAEFIARFEGERNSNNAMTERIAKLETDNDHAARVSSR